MNDVVSGEDVGHGGSGSATLASVWFVAIFSSGKDNNTDLRSCGGHGKVMPSSGSNCVVAS